MKESMKEKNSKINLKEGNAQVKKSLTKQEEDQ